MSLLPEVADRLRKADLTINEKSKFLDYMIGEGFIRVGPEKTEFITKLQALNRLRQIRR